MPRGKKAEEALKLTIEVSSSTAATGNLDDLTKSAKALQDQVEKTARALSNLSRVKTRSDKRDEARAEARLDKPLDPAREEKAFNKRADRTDMNRGFAEERERNKPRDQIAREQYDRISGRTERRRSDQAVQDELDRAFAESPEGRKARDAKRAKNQAMKEETKQWLVDNGLGPSGTTASGVAQSALNGGGIGALASGSLAGIASNITSTVIGLLVDNPIGLAAVTAGAIGLGANSMYASQQGQKYDLSAALGGGMNPVGLNQSLIGASARFSEDPGTMQKISGQLGQGGVQGQDAAMGASIVDALHQITGQDTNQFLSTVGGMNVGGGMSMKEIDQTLGELQKTAGTSKVSFDALLASLKTLQEVTGGVAINTQQMATMQALQNVAGTGVNLGSIVAPGMKATGASAIGNAAFLGISEQRLARISGRDGGKADPSALFTLQAQALQKYSAGYSGQQRIDVESLLASRLGMDTSQIPTGKQDQFFNNINNGSFQRAFDTANAKASSPRSQRDAASASITNTARKVSGDRTNLLSMGVNWLQRTGANIFNDPSNLSNYVPLMTEIPGTPGYIGARTGDVLGGIGNSLGLGSKYPWQGMPASSQQPAPTQPPVNVTVTSHVTITDATTNGIYAAMVTPKATVTPRPAKGNVSKTRH